MGLKARPLIFPRATTCGRRLDSELNDEYPIALETATVGESHIRATKESVVLLSEPLDLEKNWSLLSSRLTFLMLNGDVFCFLNTVGSRPNLPTARRVFVA